MRRRVRLVATGALVVAMVPAGCADGDDSTAPTSTVAGGTTTTTTGPPIVLGTTAALDLQVGQCYAPIPAPPEDAPTTTTPTPETTQVPSMLVTDCAGPHTAQVFAAFCLTTGEDRLLAAGECPGPPDEAWPGDREVRRAAIRVCLELFRQRFGEPYATSRRSTAELTPTEGAWRAGDHRVVCGASEPEPAPAG